MREKGMVSEPLGTDPAAAIARAEALNAQWDAIRRGDGQAAGNAPATGTVAHLMDDLRRSSHWRRKKPRTIEEIEYAFAIIEPLFGPAAVKSIKAGDCEKFYDGLRRHGSMHRAAKIMKWFRYLFSYGCKVRYQGMTYNPALSVAIEHPAPRRAVWTEDQVTSAIASATKQGEHGVAITIAIAYDTSLRPGDIRALIWEQFDGESLWLTQGKTDKPIRAPLWPETVKALDAYVRALGVTPLPQAPIVLSRSGKAFSRHHLAKISRRILRGAGLPDDVQIRDLRRTASKERADVNASAQELASATGHSIGRSAQILDVYNPPSYEAAKRVQERRRKARVRNRAKTKSLKAPA